MRKELKTVLMSIILFCTVTTVNATTVIFESGDFGSSRNKSTYRDYFGQPVFEIGSDNYTRGRINALSGSDRPSSDYSDWWSIVIPYGQQITNIDITIDNLIGSGMRVFASSHVGDCCPTGEMISGAFANPSSNGTYTLNTADPFGGIFSEGEFPFPNDRYFFGVTVPGVLASSFTYEWRITISEVSAVPIPAAAWLFSSGILFLLGISRKCNT